MTPRISRFAALAALLAAAVPAVSVAAKDRSAKSRLVTQLVTAPAADEVLLMGSTYGGSARRFSWGLTESPTAVRTVQAFAGTNRARATVSLTASMKSADLARTPLLKVRRPVANFANYLLTGSVTEYGLLDLRLPYDATRNAVDVQHLRSLPLPRLFRRAIAKLIDTSTGEIAWAD